MLSLYRSLLAYRRASGPLREGSYADLPDVPDGVLGYERVAGDERMLVVLNLTGEPKRVANAEGTVVVGTHRDREGEPFDGELRGDEGVVVDLGARR